MSVARQQPAASCGRRSPLGRVPPPPPPGRARAPRRPRPPCAAAAGDEGEVQWGRTVKLFDFTYMSPEDEAAARAAAEAAWREGMQEYAALQEWLLFRTWRFGLLFAGYLLLADSGETAFCELLGCAAGYGYFKLLIADVDKLQPGDRNALREAEELEQPLARGAAKLAAAYRYALRPRLLVLVGLAAGVAGWNAAFPDEPLGLVQQGCLLGGFVSYKVALALKIYDDLKPKPLSQEQILQQSRPSLVQVEDVKLDLRAAAKRAAQAAEAAAKSAAAEAEAAQAAEAAAGAEQPPPQQQQQQQQQQEQPR